jgi:NAD(P)-dependent dehydrogenase (short-subunit alcohol dehydrogenase family)
MLREDGTMDLGIAGKNALVCAASKGLGKGCAVNLAREGVNLTIVARTRETIEATAAPPASRSPPSRPTSRLRKAARRRSPPAPRPTS